MGRNGKSRALICFVLCMIMALPVYFSSAVAVKAAEQQTIVIGTNAEYSPFEYLMIMEILQVLITIFWRRSPRKKT